MSIDPKFVELTADVLRIFLINKRQETFTCSRSGGDQLFVCIVCLERNTMIPGGGIP